MKEKIVKKLDLPRNFKTVFTSAKKETPIELFYLWLGEQVGLDWTNENEPNTFHVTQIVTNTQDYNKLKEQLTKWVKRKYTYLSGTRLESTIGMEMLDHGPVEDDDCTVGQVWLRKGYKIKKGSK